MVERTIQVYETINMLYFSGILQLSLLQSFCLTELKLFALEVCPYDPCQRLV